MADLLESVRKQIDARMRELRPIAEEAATLEAALAVLDGSYSPVAASRPDRRTRQHPAQPGRRRTRNLRTRDQLIDHVRAHPGSTAGDVAKALGLKRASVATRLAQLAKAGELRKAVRGYAAP
jgi:hypothetical protein